VAHSLPARLKFEPLRDADITSILTIEKKVNTAPWSDRSFRNELDHAHGIFLVSKADGKVLAYGGIWLVIDEAHVTTVAVSEEHRRQGIGQALMVELMKRAKEAGMECATLEVRVSNLAAIAMYEKFGFKTAATRKGYYPENKEDAAVMWLYDLQTWEPPV